MSSPISLQRGAIREIIKLILANPNILKSSKLPKRVKRDLARESYDVLTKYFKNIRHTEKRKGLNRFDALVNAKEYELIPDKFKNINLFLSSKRDKSNLEKSTLEKIEAFT